MGTLQHSVVAVGGLVLFGDQFEDLSGQLFSVAAGHGHHIPEPHVPIAAQNSDALPVFFCVLLDSVDLSSKAENGKRAYWTLMLADARKTSAVSCRGWLTALYAAATTARPFGPIIDMKASIESSAAVISMTVPSTFTALTTL